MTTIKCGATYCKTQPEIFCFFEPPLPTATRLRKGILPVLDNRFRACWEQTALSCLFQVSRETLCRSVEDRFGN